MAVEVTQNLTQVTISSVGVAGVNGTSGTSGFSIDSGSFVTTSSYQSDSASFASRIESATNEQDLSYLATTGSNTFIGNQTISGSILLEGDRGINFGTNNTYVGMGEGALFLRDSTGYIQLDAQNNTNYAQIILNADNEDFFYVNHNTTNNNLKFTTNGILSLNEIPYDAHLATTGSNTFVGDQTISGSLNISGSINLSTSDGDIIISSSGDILLVGNSNITTTAGDITLQPFDDLRLYGGASTDENTEGGDVVIRGGQGPDEVDSVINTGGDVTIAGGSGGSGSIDSGGNGGNVNIYGGDSLTEAIGGTVRIYGGYGYDNYANVVIGDGFITNTWEFNQNTGELSGPLWTVDRGTIYLDTSTQDQKIFFGATNTSSYIGTNFGPLEIYDSSGDFKINSTNVTIEGQLNVTSSLVVTGSLTIEGSGSLNGDNIVSSNTIQKIETISSASYAALNPPISGTLYIII